MDCILVPRNVYCLDVRRMARAYIAAKIHVRALAEKLQLLIFKANILFFKQQKTRFLVPSAVNMPARGQLLARRSLETSLNKPR
jgi:hypothetical protein